MTSPAPAEQPPRGLAPLLLVTDRSATGGRPLLDVLAAAVTGGVRAVLVRDKQLGHNDRRALAVAVRRLLDPVGGQLLVASDRQLAADPEVRAEGVHLAATDPWPASWPGLVGRSCHHRADVARAAAEGCHYATLSPIWPSISKPGYGPALGPTALADLPLRTWALGGVDADRAPVARAAGAAGVAVIGAILGAPDPAAAAARLLQALHSPVTVGPPVTGGADASR